MFFGFGANNIDVLEASLPIKAQTFQVTAEETGTFAKKKNGDEGKDEDSDEGVAAEVEFDRLFECK